MWPAASGSSCRSFLAEWTARPLKSWGQISRFFICFGKIFGHSKIIPTNTLCRYLVFALKNYYYSPFTDYFITCLRYPGNRWGQNPVFLAPGSKVPGHLAGSYLDAFSQPHRHLLWFGCHGFSATKGKKMAIVKLCALHIIRSVEFPRWAKMLIYYPSRAWWQMAKKGLTKAVLSKDLEEVMVSGEEKVIVLQRGRNSTSAGQCYECVHCDSKVRDQRAWISGWRKVSKRWGPESTEVGHVDRGKVCSSIRPEKDFNTLWEGKCCCWVCVCVLCVHGYISECNHVPMRRTEEAIESLPLTCFSLFLGDRGSQWIWPLLWLECLAQWLPISTLLDWAYNHAQVFLSAFWGLKLGSSCLQNKNSSKSALQPWF